MNPVISAIHLPKFGVCDLDQSRASYEKSVFSARRSTRLDHHRPDGTLLPVIVGVPGPGAHLERRLDPAAARRQAGLRQLRSNKGELRHV